MSSTADQLDRLDAALYLRSRERIDCCAGCRYSKFVQYERPGGALLCAAARGAVVSALGVCAKWRPKAGPMVPA
jgi:hypothetical protein